jgi:protein-disulfide isomerase/uncharacterized membrane protein
LAVVTSLLGVWISFVLTMQHTRMQYMQQREKYVEAFEKVQAQGEDLRAGEDKAQEKKGAAATTQKNGGKEKELADSLTEVDEAMGEESLLEELCGGWKTSSCEDVTVSKWGEVKLGGEDSRINIPTAELGLFYFIAVFGWLVLVGQVSVSRWWYHLPFMALTAFGLGVATLLDIVMFTQLEKWCPLCFATHIGSLLLFIFALLLWPRRPKKTDVWLPVSQQKLDKISGAKGEETQPSPGKPAWPPKRMMVIAPVVILLSIALVHLYLVNRNSYLNAKLTRAYVKLQKTNLDNARESLESHEKKLQRVQYLKNRYKKHYQRFSDKWQHAYLSWSLMPKVDIDTENEPFRGPADAPHTLVEYSDFGCPSCAKFEKHLERIAKIAEPYGGVKIIFKHWPICKAGCNPYAYNDLHPQACAAAYAAEAAHVLGGSDAFWKMHEILYARQSEWKDDPSRFASYAQQIGLDVEAFKKAMDSEEVKQKVRSDVEEGTNLGKNLDEEERQWIKVNGTPAVFVDGKRLLNTRKVQAWKAIFRSGQRQRK